MPEMTQGQFADKYQPMLNEAGDFDRFSSYSKDAARREMLSRAKEEGRLWTLQDKDGELLILPGDCSYPVETYITTHPCGDGTDYVFVRGCEGDS